MDPVSHALRPTKDQEWLLSLTPILRRCLEEDSLEWRVQRDREASTGEKAVDDGIS